MRAKGSSLKSAMARLSTYSEADMEGASTALAFS
jgi:hypothetical protein